MTTIYSPASSFSIATADASVRRTLDAASYGPQTAAAWHGIALSLRRIEDKLNGTARAA